MAITISFLATNLEFSFLIRPNTKAILLTEGPVKAALLTEEVEESGESSGEAPTKAEDLGEEPLNFAEYVASAGFRSPSTRNALYKLHDRLTAGLDGEALAEVEALLAEAVEIAGELAAADQRPFGRSVEHQLKQIFNVASRGHLALPELAPGTEPSSEPAPDDGDPAPALDVSV